MTYIRRQPEKSTLYQAVSSNQRSFQARLEYEGRVLPRFVHKEFDAYLKCGRLKHGFVRIYCRACKHTRLVAFSCKKRGFCPSCTGRRMAQTAIHQTENILPDTPIRQWVFTLPPDLRIYLAYHPEAMSDTLDIFMESVRFFYRKSCLPQTDHPPTSYDPEALRDYTSLYPNDIGAITSIQRFNDALSLYPHFHTLVSDGLFVTSDPPFDLWNRSAQEQVTDVTFHQTREPTNTDLLDILIHVRYRLIKRFIYKGYLRPTPDFNDEGKPIFALYWGSEAPNEEMSQLLRCYAASTQLKHAFGPQAGERLSIDEDGEPSFKFKGPLCVDLHGFGLHAATYIERGNRERVEQMCRYINRPPISQDRLIPLEDGRFYYAFKRVWANGARGIFFDGADLMERLAALIPTPYKNIIRYHGAFAPRSRLRKAVTKRAQKEFGRWVGAMRHKRRVYWLLWSTLMKHVFKEDVLECPRCTSSMQLIAVIDQPNVIHRLLRYADTKEPP